jgi:hypothetical protein
MHEAHVMKRAKTTALAMAFLGIVLGGAASIGGCGKADEIFDCQTVCSRYHDCYDTGYDVDACRQRCRTSSENDPSVRSAANQCEACIGDKSCLSATFSCGATCGTIVP